MMLEDEMCVLKSMVFSIDDENAVFVSYQYHSEPKDTGIGNDLSKSRRRWYALVAKKSQLKSIAASLWDAGDARAKMPLDTSKWFVCFGNNKPATSLYLGEHMYLKLKKMFSWEDGMKMLDGWQSKTSHRKATFNSNAKWADSGYKAPDGEEVSLRDKAALLKHAGQPLVLDVHLKARGIPLEVSLLP